jgi:hypothetical protein
MSEKLSVFRLFERLASLTKSLSLSGILILRTSLQTGKVNGIYFSYRSGGLNLN